MRIGFLGAALAVAALGTAGAAGAEARKDAGAPQARPVVHVCERGNYAEHMLKREHGAAPFATAAEVMAVAKGEAPGWGAPRCMTGLEYARMDEALRRDREVLRARAQAARMLASR